MKALFELFRRFDARRIFGFIRRLGGMSRPKVKCYDLLSTRALQVESDTPLGLSQRICFIFLSTPSGWRATIMRYFVNLPLSYFYPRPPGGGRQHPKQSCYNPAPISIHALRVEGDHKKHLFCKLSHIYFYPRPPGGGRRHSISPRVKCNINFYPRPPGGGRQLAEVN